MSLNHKHLHRDREPEAERERRSRGLRLRERDLKGKDKISQFRVEMHLLMDYFVLIFVLADKQNSCWYLF